MPGENSSGSGIELDDFVRAYAATWASVDPANLKTLLPEPGHPLYVAVLREVVCADLRFRSDRGRPRPLEDYRNSFPELFSDLECAHVIAFEDYRLRRPGGRESDARRLRAQIRRGRYDHASPARDRGIR